MKVSREQAAANRERILDAAGRLFRERGLEGIGVADLMRDAGLTHGGFYGHFASKKELMAITCANAPDASLKRWRRIAERVPERPVAVIAKRYLTQKHRDDPGAGCTLAAIAGDAARQDAPVRRAFAEGLRPFVDFLASVIPGRTKAARRQKALATLSGMVGAMVLARAVDDVKLSEEILEAMAATIDSTV
jgi:TetR/AcrR family transcriptional regulator, transcriptional repressor for nem operon